MSFALKKGQKVTIVATFADATQNPPVSYPLASQPVFSDPTGNLVLTPDPNNQLAGPFTCTGVWADTAQAGATGVVKCHGEGEADGSDPIDCADLAYTLLAADDNFGSMEATVGSA